MRLYPLSIVITVSVFFVIKEVGEINRTKVLIVVTLLSYTGVQFGCIDQTI